MYVMTCPGLTLALHRCNGTAAFRKCIQAIILYTNNIVQHIDSPKYHRVKLSNKNFQNFVLSLEGGLSFFMCSPVYWRVCFIHDTLVCREDLVACSIKNNNSHLKAKWVEVMTRYSLFLMDVLQLDYFQIMS
jgi:hypothetical protein